MNVQDVGVSRLDDGRPASAAFPAVAPTTRTGQVPPREGNQRAAASQARVRFCMTSTVALRRKECVVRQIRVHLGADRDTCPLAVDSACYAGELVVCGVGGGAVALHRVEWDQPPRTFKVRFVGSGAFQMAWSSSQGVRPSAAAASESSCRATRTSTWHPTVRPSHRSTFRSGFTCSSAPAATRSVKREIPGAHVRGMPRREQEARPRCCRVGRGKRVR